jgi:hypothetical protein
MMALKMLLVKVGLSDIGFVLGVTEETVLMWLERAAQKAHEINMHLLRNLPVTQVPLDEMWSFIRRKHAQQAEADGESPDLSEDGRQWVWISFAPEFRLILAVLVGPRTFDSALQLIQKTAAVVLGVPSGQSHLKLLWRAPSADSARRDHIRVVSASDLFAVNALGAAD